MPKKMVALKSGIYPKPIAMVSYVDEQGHANIVTLAGVGVVCADPPTLGLAIRPNRYSNRAITASGECVVNIPNTDLLWAADICGNASGRDTDKFAAAKLTPTPAQKVKVPLINECPVNLECELKHKLRLGSHDLLICEVVAVHIEEYSLDNEGKWDFTKLQPMAACELEYRSLGPAIGLNGFSRRK